MGGVCSSGKEVNENGRGAIGEPENTGQPKPAAEAAVPATVVSEGSPKAAQKPPRPEGKKENTSLHVNKPGMAIIGDKSGGDDFSILASEGSQISGKDRDATLKEKLADVEKSDMPAGKDVEDAAVKIQASFRGQKARKEVAELKEGKKEEKKKGEKIELPEGKDVEDAAVKIQASFRGKQARKEVAELKEGKKEEKKKGEDKIELPEGKDVEDAAVKIQASFRGKQARKEVAELKEGKTEEKKKGEDKIELPEGKDVEDAAVKIQASFRGKQARKEVAGMKAAKK